jgi:hypothetical protein
MLTVENWVELTSVWKRAKNCWKNMAPSTMLLGYVLVYSTWIWQKD